MESQNANLAVYNASLKKSIQDLKAQNNLLTNQNITTRNSLYKLTPQAYLKLVEIHLAEHCNLNCFSCAHFSQLSPAQFPSLEQFSKDMEQLNSLTNGLIGKFHLMGGEPLLNPSCKDFFAITRKYFPNSAIWLVTNGILLNKQPKEFWESCRENNIEIHPTKYPIKIDWERIEAQCED
ncbi:radical SAM protein, partial [Helicobacter sp.]|uniref:radical SAM protein n=1 Tax=Helicobacter sp. TaxID=218 RepID=UPI0025C23CD5